jgi:hypothetical protein
MKLKLLLCIIIFLCSNNSFSQWSTDPAENTRISNYGLGPFITTDGNGGAIIAWHSDFYWYDIVAQKVDSAGYFVWPEQDIVVCNAKLDQVIQDIVSDGKGGAYIVWKDHRRGIRPDMAYQDSSDVYMQHIKANGQILCQENGIRISNGLDFAHHAKMAADDSNGVVVAWINQDEVLSNRNIAVFMQRISSGGEFLWSEDSVKILAPNYDREPSLAIINDGNNGVLVSCSEGIFRYSMQGELTWQVTNIPGRLTDYSLVSDGDGGGIFYYSNHINFNYKLYTQRVNLYGELLWGENGLFVTTKVRFPSLTSIVPDNNSGVYISWVDSSYSYQLNRIDSVRNLLWKDDSLSFGAFFAGRNLLNDNENNVIIIYRDSLYSDSGLIQKLNPIGGEEWKNEGKMFSYSAMRDSDPTMISDDNNGAIIVWYERYSYERWGIFAQRVNKYGKLGCITSVKSHPDLMYSSQLNLLQNYPNPFNQKTIINYSLRHKGDVQLLIFNTHGEEVITLVNKAQLGGNHKVIWNGKNNQGSDVSSGIYFYQLKVNEFMQTKKLTVIR